MKPAAGAILLVLLLAAAQSGCGPGFAVPERQAAPSSSRAAPVVHVVRRGDTLYSIAFDAGLDYRAVARWNGIDDPYLIIPGQKIRLRPPPGYRAPRPTAARAARKTTTEPASTASSPDERAPRASSPPTSTAAPGWLWPARGPIIRGFSRDNTNPGIEIAGEAGAIVKSAADGRVVYSGDGLRGYGQLIIVKHNETFLSAYAHNRKLLVQEGDRVRRGQPIAEMGATGTDRVKLHFEIRKQGTAVDPLLYLPKT